MFLTGLNGWKATRAHARLQAWRLVAGGETVAFLS